MQVVNFYQKEVTSQTYEIIRHTQKEIKSLLSRAHLNTKRQKIIGKHERISDSIGKGGLVNFKKPSRNNGNDLKSLLKNNLFLLRNT